MRILPVHLIFLFLLCGGFFFCAHFFKTYRSLLIYLIFPSFLVIYGIYEYATYELSEENDGFGYGIGLAVVVLNIIYVPLGGISAAITIWMRDKGYKFVYRAAVPTAIFAAIWGLPVFVNTIPYLFN